MAPVHFLFATSQRTLRSLLAVFILFFACSLSASAQKLTSEEYITKFKDIAVREMKITGIPASITLAQGLLESSSGNSALTQNAKNHFGIKCKANWTGKSYTMDDDEANECFRHYETDEESYLDHSYFLVTNSRYDFLFDLDATDYEAWAKGLKTAGYATNPKYPDLLVTIIERYKLDQYDEGNNKIDKDNRLANVKDAKTQFASTGKVVVPEPTPEERLALDEEKLKKSKDEELAKDIHKPENALASMESKYREYLTFNEIPACVTRAGDSYESIARENKMMFWEVRRYNDLESTDLIEPGTIVYLKPKRRKGKKDFHEVRPNESMYYIAQLEGIKLKKLYKYNRMREGEEPLPGQILNLRKKRDNPPKFQSAELYAIRRGVQVKLQDVKTTTPGKPVQSVSLEPIIAKDTTPAYHVVKNNESIFDIASIYNISIHELQEWNGIATGRVYAGQKLAVKAPAKPTMAANVPSTRATASTSTSSASSATASSKVDDVPALPASTSVLTPTVPDYHVVQAGEGLYAIARKYAVPVAKIRDLNALDGDNLKIGDRLRLK